MKQRIISTVLALCLCISSQSLAYASQGEPLPQEDIFIEGSAAGQEAREGELTPTGVYEAMIALQEQEAYKEGTPWTNDEPYSDSKGYYHWKGGPLGGTNISAVGCVAFAFILSDAAFGNLSSRMYAPGAFTYEDIKPGDILRMSGDAHTVIVLEVSDVGVVVAEGNISTGDHKGKVHWGRSISKEEVMSNTSHYITRYPEGYIPPNDPDADTSIENGTLDGGLAWDLTKAGTLTVSGSGDMPDLSSVADQPWNSYKGQIRKIVIGDGVASIGNSSFWECGVLSVTIPSSVTRIGNYAFHSSSLISVTIPSSVTTIGDSAFQGCQGLSSVTVSEGVETIGQNAFRGCMSLTSIALPASIGEVGAAAFCECQKMTSATFAPGSKQVKMGDNMFTRCYYLMRVTLPTSIDRIGEGMFQNCGMLAGVEIPQGAASIGGSAFASSGVSVVVIPDSVRTIGIAAFSACPLSDIYFTGNETQWNSISKIGDTATAVSKATIHYNYTPSTSPEPEPSLTPDPSPTLTPSPSPTATPTPTWTPTPSPTATPTPSPTSTPDPSPTLTPSPSPTPTESPSPSPTPDPSPTATASPSPSPTASPSPSPTLTPSPSPSPRPTPLAKGKTFTVGKATYKVTKAGREVELIKSRSTAARITVSTVKGTDGVEYKVTSIGSKAMQGNRKMTSLTIGADIKTIRSEAFSGCTKLATVTFGKNVSAIGVGAFKGCTALRGTIVLPDSVQRIRASVFSGCHKIEAVTIGNTSRSGLTMIGRNAFNGCRRLGRVTIRSAKLTYAKTQAFKDTRSDLKVKVPSKQLTKYRKLLQNAGVKAKQVIK